MRRARDLATAPFDAAIPPLPDALNKLDFDAWRDIRFRPDKAFLAGNGSQFRLQLFHLGHLFKRPVTINIIRDGIPTPIPFTTSLFDYGHTKPEKPIPVNLGFAGFRLHYPVNSPKVFDEAIAFLGASYFRFLGRDQRYGMSARALAIDAGTDAEEFPFFREFWIDTPEPNANRATIYGLLDSQSTTGAYRFDLYPGVETAIEVSTTLFPRKADVKFGLAPLTSMFFLGENDHRFNEDFRPELHDSDGLLIHSGTGEWMWRPLRNPVKPEMSSFFDRDLKGFGLLQRDRDFDHYQDLDLSYELRPSYFVEPRDSWGEGHVDLVELPTPNETNDNIVASFAPRRVRPSPASPSASTPIVSLRAPASRGRSPNGRWRTGTPCSDVMASVRSARRAWCIVDRAALSSILSAATCPIMRLIRRWSRSFLRRARARSCARSWCRTLMSKDFERRSTSSSTPGNRPICVPFCGLERGL